MNSLHVNKCNSFSRDNNKSKYATITCIEFSR